MDHRAEPQLNVLFVTADQFRGDCLGAAGHPVVRTPNLDRLAADGVSFRRHFANASPCAPSRASLYTGMYLMNHRGATNGTPLDDRHDNLARVARRAGYAPGLFGYTDTGIDPRTVAADDPRLWSYEGVLPGFDPVCHLPEGEPDAWLAFLRDAGYDLGESWRTFVDTPEPGTRARTRYRAEHSQTAFLTDRVLEHLEQHTERHDGVPWFAHVSYLRPHPPYLAPAPYDTMYDPASVPDPVRAPTREVEGAQHPLLRVMLVHPMITSPDTEEEQRAFEATYFGMVSEVDTQLGRIFDWLDSTGQADTTLVVFTSDHGELLGDHWLVQKIGWFDSAYHVPLIVRDPRTERDATRGTTVDAMTEHVDVLPTMCELLGTDVPVQCDGRSLARLLVKHPTGVAEEQPPWRNEVHFELDLRDPASEFLEQMYGISLEECSLAVLRDEHGKYVQFAAPHVFPAIFFDLDRDPDQLHNVAADPAYAARVLDYAQRMLSWRMRHAERTLTGMKLTGHAGLVERHARRG